MCRFLKFNGDGGSRRGRGLVLAPVEENVPTLAREKERKASGSPRNPKLSRGVALRVLDELDDILSYQEAAAAEKDFSEIVKNFKEYEVANAFTAITVYRVLPAST